MARHSLAQIINNQLRRVDLAGNELPPISLDGDDWQNWLNAQETRSFTYRSTYGTLTARRELRNGVWYWYGYHSQDAKLRKMYLGKADALTLHRLDEAIRKLAQCQMQIEDYPIRSQRRRSRTIPVLRTRLVVPPLPPYILSRPHLLQVLQKASARTLTLLNAPAGSGKTTLLSQWAASSASPVAWLSLHEEDNDPQSFLTYLIEAFRPLCSASEYDEYEEALMPHSMELFSLSEALACLINRLVSLTRDVTLILDNYHVIKNSVVHAGLKFLLAHLPPRVHLMVATRSPLPFSLVRLFAHGQVIEVRASMFRFTQEETCAFLSSVTNTLSSEDMIHLAIQSEGWVAGLQMMTLVLQMEGSAPHAGICGADNRYIQDYFVEEVLNQQPVHLQTVLLYTSLLDCFDGSLCSAMTGLPNAQLYLEQLEHESLFIVPLDQRKGWYRYYRLFAETMRRYLERTQPDLVQLLHLRASQWFEHYDSIEDAINHSLAARDVQRAATLIEQIAHVLLGNAEITALQNWLKVLPTDIIRASPRLCITSAWLLFLTTQANPFVFWLDAAEEALHACEENISAEAAATLHSEIAALRSIQHIHFNDFNRVITTCNRILPSLPPENFFARGLLLLTLGLAYQRGINVASAAQVLSEASSYSRSTRHALLIPYVMISQAELYELQGSPFQSLKLYQQVLKLTNRQPGHATGISVATMGYLFWEWGNIDTARKYLLEAWNVGLEIQNTNVIVNSAFFLTLVSQAQGHADEANARLQRLETYLLEVAPFDGVEAIALIRAWLSLEQGHLEDALLWAQRRRCLSEKEISLYDDVEDLLLARILIAAGKSFSGESYLRCAQVLLEHLWRSAEAIGKTKLLIEVSAMQALLLYHKHDIAGALAALERALVLAEPGKYVRVFLDKGDPMAMLLRQLRDRYKARKTESGRRLLIYVRKLLAAFIQPVVQPVHTLPVPVEGLPLLEPLSWREQEVLRLMAAGRKNQEIARELVIVIGTVKSHTNSIYRKLAVNSRVQAVARARSLHLL